MNIIKTILSKNIILFVVLIIFCVLTSAITISALDANSSSDTVAVCDDLGLSEKDDLIEKEFIEKDENDLLAITLMRKYKRTDLTDLPSDKTTDCELMKSMCAIINEDCLSDDEEYVIKMYLSRRVGWLNVSDGTEKSEVEAELQNDIQTILGFEYEE